MQEWSQIMNGRAFITDLGESPTKTIEGVETKIGRYAVWSPVTNSDSHQIVEVGEDLKILMDKYGIPLERVCCICNEQQERSLNAASVR